MSEGIDSQQPCQGGPPSDLNKYKSESLAFGTFVSDVSDGTLVTDTAGESSRYVRFERKTLPDPCSEEGVRKGWPLQVSRKAQWHNRCMSF